MVRLGAMGDILHALPAVTALRVAHPDWVIDWVVEPRWRPLLAASGVADSVNGHYLGEHSGQPLVDHIYLAPAKEWGSNPFGNKTIDEVRALRSALKAGGYDAVLDLQGAVRSALIGRLAVSQRLIGEARPREWFARWLFTERVATRGAHVIEQDVELAAAVAGDALMPAIPWLPIDAAAEVWAGEVLPFAVGWPAVLISPGAGWGAKRWPAERYAALAQDLVDRGLRVLVNAGPGEESLAEAIVQSVAAAIPLTCTLDRLIALTRRVALAIAGDTGPLHLACALGRPVVGIYGPTDPCRNGPFGTTFRVLRSPTSRRDHARRAAPEAGLLTISQQDVLRAADELLRPESTV